MTSLADFGYSRALWIAAPGKWWLRPDSRSVVSEEEALREVAQLVDEEDDDPRPAA